MPTDVLGPAYDCLRWELDGALWASVPRVPGLCLPEVLLGLEEMEALLSVHQGAVLAELPGPFQCGHSKTSRKRMSNGQCWVGP